MPPQFPAHLESGDTWLPERARSIAVEIAGGKVTVGPAPTRTRQRRPRTWRICGSLVWGGCHSKGRTPSLARVASAGRWNRFSSRPRSWGPIRVDQSQTSKLVWSLNDRGGCPGSTLDVQQALVRHCRWGWATWKCWRSHRSGGTCCWWHPAWPSRWVCQLLHRTASPLYFLPSAAILDPMTAEEKKQLPGPGERYQGNSQKPRFDQVERYQWSTSGFPSSPSFPTHWSPSWC